MLFFETHLATMNREWNGIDRLRMDKFYMLVRNMFQESLIYLKSKEWEKGGLKCIIYNVLHYNLNNNVTGAKA